MKKIASITPAMSKESQLTRDAWHLHAHFVFVVTESAMIRGEFVVTVAYELEPASKNGKRQKEEANRSAIGGGLLAAL